MQLYSTPPRTAYQPLVIPEDVPVYRILEGKFFADDELYEPGSIITWDEEPNLEMQPLNKLAQERAKAYRLKLDEYGRKVADKNGTAFISIDHAFEQANMLAQNESRRVNVLNAMPEVPIMGGKRTRAPKAKKIELNAETDPLVSGNNKLSLNSAREINNAAAKKL